MPGVGRHNFSAILPTPAYDPVSAAWFAAVGPLSPGHMQIVDTLVRGLRSASILSKLDYLLLMANETVTASLTDIISLRVATAVNTPTYTQFRGYTGNGTTSYINSGYSPSTMGVALQLNDCHISAYVRNTRTSGNEVAGGVYDGSAAFNINALYGGNEGAALCDLTGVGASPSVIQAQGFSYGHRANVTDQGLYRNGAQTGFAVVSSISIPTGNAFICARNEIGSPSIFSADEIAMFSMGAGLPGAPQSVLDYTNLIEAYMDAIGAGVL